VVMTDRMVHLTGDGASGAVLRYGLFRRTVFASPGGRLSQPLVSVPSGFGLVDVERRSVLRGPPTFAFGSPRGGPSFFLSVGVKDVPQLGDGSNAEAIAPEARSHHR